MGTDANWIACFPDLKNSADTHVKHLIARARTVRLGLGAEVFVPSASCKNYLLVVRGSVRVQLLTEGGHEVLLYRVQPGESCVLTTSCLMSGERYPAAAVTENEVEAVVVDRVLFDETMQHSPDFRRFVFKGFGRRLGQVIVRMDEVAFGPIGRRLAGLLESQAPVAHATHQELAAELGSSREVVSRYLKRYEDQGWIRLHRGAIEILDLAAIRRLARDAV